MTAGSTHYHPCDFDCPNGLTAGGLAHSAAEIRGALFAELRDNLGAIVGTEIYRPYYGGRYVVHRRHQIEEWLNEMESKSEERIEEEERRG
jgi:hypothetical protein